MTTGQQLKQEGLDAVEWSHMSWIDQMRYLAHQIWAARKEVSTDDLQDYVSHNLMPAPDKPNAWGAIFRGTCWRELRRQKSRIPSNHAREIRVWVYVP